MSHWGLILTPFPPVSLSGAGPSKVSGLLEGGSCLTDQPEPGAHPQTQTGCGAAPPGLILPGPTSLTIALPLKLPWAGVSPHSPSTDSPGTALPCPAPQAAPSSGAGTRPGGRSAGATFQLQLPWCVLRLWQHRSHCASRCCWTAGSLAFGDGAGRTQGSHKACGFPAAPESSPWFRQT